MKRRDDHRRAIDGVLYLDKPIGVSSNHALQEVKRLFFAKKAGHTGSLDPLATGLLPICFGRATKFSQYLLNSDKAYAVTAKLGIRTTTSDAEGEIVEEHEVPSLTLKKLDKQFDSFRGAIKQIPSMFSALKKDGVPLYKLARQGITVERDARDLMIYGLNVISYDKEQHEVKFTLHCSKGTYVRTIVDDFGQLLGCGAHVTALRRTGVGALDAESMVTMDELRELKEKDEFAAMDALVKPVDVILESWPSVTLASSTAFYLKQGNPVMVPHAPTSGWVRFNSQDGVFIGIGEVLDNGMVAPRKIVS